MPPISVLIKPSSSNCNLKCKYCFYNDVSNNREEKSYGFMTYETLEILVKKVFEYGEDYIGFVFQGGEPTLVGLDFYKNLMELQEKYNVKKVKINNAIQTNGISIDEEWAEFLGKNKFLVGISLDGPKDINDLNRIDLSRNGTYSRIEKTIERFNKYGVEYNVLVVVTKAVAKHIQKIYSYFDKKGFKYLQFIPCLDDLGSEAGKNIFSLTPEVYGDFLKKLFDLWYRDFIQNKRISIRMFDNIIQMFLGYQPEACDMRGICSANLVIEANGTAYPCDFYVIDKWEMGNILKDDIKDLLGGKVAKEFVNQSKDIGDNCDNCRFIYICRGGCRRNYEPIKEKGINKNYFCLSYKEFYGYTISRFQEIAEIVRGY
jgi:anaerobic sulfatase-maturating enzyme